MSHASEQGSLSGALVSGKGIEADPEKVRSVFDWPIPLNQKDLKRFLGLASYYRRFVEGFAQVAAPLNAYALTDKGKEWLWTAECTQAFLELKKRLVSAPVLVMPQFNRDFYWTRMLVVRVLVLYCPR